MNQTKSTKSTFLIKIIPPTGYSVYRLAFTRRHLALAAAALIAVVLGAIGVHTYELHVAEVDVRTLQGVTTAQQAQLQNLDKQADALATQLRTVQHENAEIKRLMGVGPSARKPHAMAPARPGAGANLASVQSRLRQLASQSAATQRDARALQALALRVLNVRRLASLARDRMIASIPSLMPVQGARIASGFGWRSTPWPEYHQGVDLAVDYGTMVRAAAAGTVVTAGWDGGFGIKVAIDHGNGYQTWYGHLSRTIVTVGEHITKGAPIAYTGSTGESTGPHLHYQVMYEGHAIDPAPFLNGVPPHVLATLPDGSGV
ncbi:MAG TPA: peptidoglycan DD-metalloendopeptidase family protein [Candidatus Sulfotelmatobacter sp.]|nr:peptidoglycan DD-metalloendopeptidase family protein [Candidatus Sulfotelmatobacter sp.]